MTTTYVYTEYELSFEYGVYAYLIHTLFIWNGHMHKFRSIKRRGIMGGAGISQGARVGDIIGSEGGEQEEKGI